MNKNYKQLSKQDIFTMFLNDDNKDNTLNDKIKNLKAISKYLSDKEFKFILASIVAQSYIDSMNFKGKKVTRAEILDRVNLVLTENGCDKVSYEYIRKFT